MQYYQLNMNYSSETHCKFQ